MTFTHTALPGAPASVSVVSGQGQVGPPGTVLTDSLVVLVDDEAGNPIGGVSVTWVVTDGAGTVSPAASVTDELGMASTSWTLGAEPGANVVDAVVSGVGSVEFSAVATQPGARVLALVRQPSTAATVGEAHGAAADRPASRRIGSRRADVRRPRHRRDREWRRSVDGLLNRNTDESGPGHVPRPRHRWAPRAPIRSCSPRTASFPVVSESVEVQ